MMRKVVIPHPCVRGKLVEAWLDLGPGVGRFHRGERGGPATLGRTRRRGGINTNRVPAARGASQLGFVGRTL